MNGKKSIKTKALALLSLLLVLACLFGACNDRTDPPVESDSESVSEQFSGESLSEPSDSQSEPSDSQSEPSDSQSEPSDSQSEPSDSQSEPSYTDSEPVGGETDEPVAPETPALSMPTVDLDSIPAYDKLPYISINGGMPFFTPNQLVTQSYEYYSALDGLGRCGITVACVGRDIMPTSDRGDISSVRPSGWVQAEYSIVDGQNLYNRCHLIAFQLTGENANRENLITGTRYMNVQGMIPFENMVADYVKETGNHVMYRVTPIFVGSELVARGVVIEGYSVEDNGEGICFCAYAYNVQPGILINYATGESQLDPSYQGPDSSVQDYVLNTRSKKFHYPTCSSVDTISDKNKGYFTGTRDELKAQGFEPCGSCRP